MLLPGSRRPKNSAAALVIQQLRGAAHETFEIAHVHPAVAAAMTFVDRDTEPRLERILSEIRAHAKQAARA